MMHTDTTGDVMDKAQRNASLAVRQARVGIVANTVPLSLPMHRPRDVWTRWPKLRSARRVSPAGGGAHDQADDQADDPVLNGARLRDFALDLRGSAIAEPDPPPAEMPIAPQNAIAPPFATARLAIRLALGVLVAGLALMGISLIFR